MTEFLEKVKDLLPAACGFQGESMQAREVASKKFREIETKQENTLRITIDGLVAQLASNMTNKINNTDFFSYKKIKDLEQYLKNNRNNKNQIFRDLVEWELFRHGIYKEEFTIDFNNKKILKIDKIVSLRMNEGFLNSFTLERLFKLRFGESYYLAKCFVEAGIEVPKEVFVGVFGN